MRTFIVGQDADIQTLRQKLFAANLGPARAEAALKALQAANPHADLTKLAPGTVLFVPDSPSFNPSAAASPADAPFDLLKGVLESALRSAVDNLKAENARRIDEQSKTAAAFGSDAVRRIASTEDGAEVAARIATIVKNYEADRQQGVQAEQTVATIARAAQAKFAELRKQFG